MTDPNSTKSITNCIATASETELKKRAASNVPRWFAIQFMETRSGSSKKSSPTARSMRAKSIIGARPPTRNSTATSISPSPTLATNLVGATSPQKAIVREGEASGETLTDKIDRVVLNRWLGLPIFLFVMYADVPLHAEFRGGLH